eukprot:TRINITY_DN7543_c0_g1_i2.p2 TRINITY_DN7543_c0_g1~~TRINITY_DN7543_c0_g1_i2.p2  ORF type:complete len:321 (+),score=92.28 TRINITY_DN7543_c0_g1_i2:2-964(+)
MRRVVSRTVVGAASASAPSSAAAPTPGAVLRAGRRAATGGAEDYGDDTWLSGRQTLGDVKRMKVGRRRKSDVSGRLPAVDYLSRMEESYGPKESWHRADDMFMRKGIPILCRKIDDLRERLADFHRYHNEYRTAAQEELRKIPLYKREAWMSPDLTRSLLLDELRSKGYLDESGRLKDLPQSLPVTPDSPHSTLLSGGDAGAASHHTPIPTPTPSPVEKPEQTGPRYIPEESGVGSVESVASDLPAVSSSPPSLGEAPKGGAGVVPVEEVEAEAVSVSEARGANPPPPPQPSWSAPQRQPGLMLTCFSSGCRRAVHPLPL